jgi:type VI secretion system secreted protein Hcp
MAFDCFLKIDGVPGESTDDKHKQWIEILSYSHGVSQMAAGSRSTGGAASGGRCDHQDFSITKAMDKASPPLNATCCDGKHIKKIILDLCRATGDKQEYMKYTLEDVIVSSVSVGASSGGDLPIESVTFNYGKINWVYTETDHETGKKKGEVKKWWDLVKNIGG